jgi:hypothetical protein
MAGAMFSARPLFNSLQQDHFNVLGPWRRINLAKRRGGSEILFLKSAIRID